MDLEHLPVPWVHRGPEGYMVALLVGTGRRDPGGLHAACHPEPRNTQQVWLDSCHLAQNYPSCTPNSQSASEQCSEAVLKTYLRSFPPFSEKLLNAFLKGWKPHTEGFALESPSLLSYRRKTCKIFASKTPSRNTIPPKKQSPAASVSHMGPKHGVTAAAPAAKSQPEMKERAAGSTAAAQKCCWGTWMRTTRMHLFTSQTREQVIKSGSIKPHSHSTPEPPARPMEPEPPRSSRPNNLYQKSVYFDYRV